MTMHLSPSAEAALARHAKAWRDGYDSGYANRMAEEIEQTPTLLVPTQMDRQAIDDEARAHPGGQSYALIWAQRLIEDLRTQARRDAELIETLRSSRDAAINRLSEVAASAAEVYDDRPWSELHMLLIDSDGAPPSIGNGTVTAIRRPLPPAAPSDCPGFELRFKFEPGTLTRLGSGSRWIFSTPGFGPDNLTNGDVTDGAP